MFCNLYYSACGRIFQDHNFTDYGGSLEKRSAKEVHHDALEAELTQPGGIVDPRYVATVRKTLSPECFASFMRTVDVPVTKRDYYLSKLFQFFVSALLFRCGFNEEAEESCRALAKMLDGIADLPTER